MSTKPIWFRYLSGLDIDELGISQPEIITAVEDVMAAHGRGETSFEPRMHLMPNNGGIGHFNVLRGHVDTLGARGLSGVKVVGDFVPNFKEGLPSELAMATLFDPYNGTPLSVMNATLITEVRTGAMTAVGAKFLARKDAKILGHIGARGTAFSNVTMLDSIFEFEEIRVTSRRPESREAFADELRNHISTPVRVTESAEETIENADIMVEASRLMEPTPLVRTSAVKPGAFVVPYGTVSAVEDSLLDVMDKVVVDDWREAQSGRFGALRHQVDSGKLNLETLHAELGQVVTGERSARENDEERILFWHRGLSILDVAVADLILRRAEEAGAGTMLRYQ